MKITKSRLLEIIREEVELHEKNTFIFEETELQDSSAEEDADKDGDGELSDKERKKAIDDEIRADRDAGNIKEADVEEDQLIKKGDGVIKPKKNKKLEIKIR